MGNSSWWSLFRALSNVHFGLSNMRFQYLKKRERLWEPLLILASLGAAAVVLIIFVVNMAYGLVEQGMIYGQPEIALTFAAVGAQSLILFFAIFFVMSAFYFSDDLKILIPLPYKPWEILTAKLLTILVSQLIPVALFVIPIWVVYAIRVGGGIAYWLSAVLVLISIPILPLTLATMLVVIVMRLVNIGKRRDLFTMIAGFLLVFSVIGFQLYLQYSLPGADPEQLFGLLAAEAGGLVRIVGRLFPPSVWATRAMAQPTSFVGLGNLLLFVGLSAASFVLCLQIANRFFYRGVIAGFESGNAGKKAIEHKASAFAMHPVIWRVALTELKLFLRNPGYVLNGITGYLILPVLVLVPYLGVSIEGNPLQSLIGSVIPPQVGTGIIAVFVTFMGAMSTIPATTFSREGKYLWNIRVLPLSALEVINGKVLAAQIVNLVGSLIGIAVLVYVLELSILYALLGLGLGMIISTGVAGLFAMIDLARPMLHWTDPIKAVKTNLNVLIAMAVSAVISGFLGWRVYAHFQGTSLNWIILELLIFGGIIVLAFGLMARRFATKRWSIID